MLNFMQGSKDQADIFNVILLLHSSGKYYEESWGNIRVRNAQKIGRSLFQTELVKYKDEKYSWGNIMVQTIMVRNIMVEYQDEKCTENRSKLASNRIGEISG